MPWDETEGRWRNYDRSYCDFWVVAEGLLYLATADVLGMTWEAYGHTPQAAADALTARLVELQSAIGEVLSG